MNDNRERNVPQPLQSLVIAMVVCLLPTSWAWAQVSPDDPAFADQLLYHRAFEIALWALPATDSFAAREAIERDLGGKANDIVINTKPLNADIHLVALQT